MLLLSSPNKLLLPIILGFLGASASVVSSESDGSGFKGYQYTSIIGNFVGYSAEMSQSIAEAASTVAPNSHASTSGIPTNCTVRPLSPLSSAGDWGLGRISHFPNIPDPFRTAHNTYRYNLVGLCSRTTAYVLGSGIPISHPEFSDRTIRCGFQSNPAWPRDDVGGHGNHVAGIIGGINYGAQSATQLVALKALEGRDTSCNGTWSGIISGIEFAVKDAHDRGILESSVLVMSLGGEFNEVVNNAVNAAVDAGLTVVASARNSGSDACLQSPASSEIAITVGSSNVGNEIAETSNTGCCVDLFAPGENIGSVYVGKQYRTLSGTSLAISFVGGLVLYNKCRFGYITPTQDKIGVTGKENVIRGKLVQGDNFMDSALKIRHFRVMECAHQE